MDIPHSYQCARIIYWRLTQPETHHTQPAACLPSCVLVNTQAASGCSCFMLLLSMNCILGDNSVADESMLLNVNIVEKSMVVMTFI